VLGRASVSGLSVGFLEASACSRRLTREFLKHVKDEDQRTRSIANRLADRDDALVVWRGVALRVED
jgi:hypothetical protein